MGKDEILAILEKHLTTIQDCISKGCHKYLEKHLDSLHIYSKITRASITRDYILDFIRKAFSNKDGVRIIEKRNGLILLEIGKRILLRFKKLNSMKCASNIPTNQSMAFYRQLPMFPARQHKNLNAGYVANETWTNFEFYITEPNGRRSNAWILNMKAEHNSKPSVSISSPNRLKPIRVKAKTASDKKSKGAENEGSNA
jgi:hypothetical protein